MTREKYGLAYQKGFASTVRFLLSRGVPSDSANESAQAAWARGWERLSQLRDEATLLTWVNSIALNVYRGVIRRECYKEPLTEFHGKGEIDLARIDLARILEVCRPADRSLLELCLQGVSMKEIAGTRGVTETAIRIRLLRARRSARVIAEKQARQRRDRCRPLIQKAA